MKKINLSLLLVFCSVFAFSQVVPSFQFGLKGGLNLSKFSTSNTFSSDNQAGYYGGIWARIGGAGIHLQPEVYLSGKNTTIEDNGVQNKVKFKSLDVPVLIGTKIGAAGIGLRLATGPVVSFVIDKEQSISNAASAILNGNFKDQAFAWQFGAGFDFRKLGIDVRYELGLSKNHSELNAYSTKLNLYTVGLAYKLY